jgi:hypothetical protein
MPFLAFEKRVVTLWKEHNFSKVVPNVIAFLHSKQMEGEKLSRKEKYAWS